MTDAELVDALADIEDGLRERELEFVDDISKELARHRGSGKADRDYCLSPRQRNWGDAIWERLG